MTKLRIRVPQTRRQPMTPPDVTGPHTLANMPQGTGPPRRGMRAHCVRRGLVRWSETSLRPSPCGPPRGTISACRLPVRVGWSVAGLQFTSGRSRLIRTGCYRVGYGTQLIPTGFRSRQQQTSLITHGTRLTHNESQFFCRTLVTRLLALHASRPRNRVFAQDAVLCHCATGTLGDSCPLQTFHSRPPLDWRLGPTVPDTIRSWFLRSCKYNSAGYYGAYS